MSDQAKVPAWQRAPTDATPMEPATSQEAKPEQQAPAPLPTEDDLSNTETVEEATEDVDLLEQASRFLEDSSIRDAPREKKVAFLESKGVKAEDIDALLGAKTGKTNTPDLLHTRERAWSTLAPTPTSAPPIIAQPRDVPPIVTYPEFLASSEKPPPLVTTKRLLATAYVTGGLMASIYGLSKYIVGPMAENLADSRHNFASHTQEQLRDLNERLGKAVSVDPASTVKTITDAEDDISEADSDPTELFHRDYGTQTTPNLSRRPSTSSTVDTESTVTAHETHLKTIKAQLQELESSQLYSESLRDGLKTKVSDLTTYLSEMSYQTPYYSNMNGFYGGSYGLPSGKDGKTDQIEMVKTDIRAVKGVFLSARNFPAGARSTPSVPGGTVGA